GSPLYGWYAQRRFPPALNGAVRPKLEYIRNLPIATPPDAQRAAIEARVEQRIALEAECRAGDPGAAERARDLDAAIDEAVLDIYELTAGERARVRAAAE